MSAIFGLWRIDDRPVDSDSLARMSESLAHRGPDGADAWIDGSVGLGQRMLRTTPESVKERQPLVALGGDLVLTADARIDNRSDVIPALGLLGPPHETISDADLLLAAYERWGERCAEHLIGDFAFVVWDARRRALICFRDHFGVKPLYYFNAPGRLFAFASEVEGLLTLEEVPDEINEIEVGRHLYIPLGVDEGATYYKHVQKLLPAHTLTVSSRGLDERPYWQLDPTRELKLSSDDEYAEAFRESFVEAVRCRLRSNTPVASLLSGGLDSSAITCVAARLGGSGVLHTLSAVYPSVRESDEQSFIDEVLARYTVIPHFFDAESVNPFAQIDRINRLAGGATYGGNLYLTWELYRLAASLGARVVLHGYDGDSTVSHGTYYTPELALSGRWLKLALVSIPYSLKRGRSPIADYLGLVRSGVRLRLRGVLGRDGNRSTVTPNPLINEAFAHQFADRMVPDPKPPITEREFHARMLTGQRLLEGLGWGEACGAGRGVEVRYPFFDVRLAKLCLSLPPDQKIRRGWTRFVMRRAMEGILPAGIQWRLAKTRMHHGWASAYRSNENGRIQALLNEPNPMVSRYLDVERLRALHERFMAGDATTAEQRPLWRAITIALWLISQPLDSRSSMRPSFSNSEQ